MKYIYALVLASALAGCSDTVSRSQIAIALDLCKDHGGVDTATMGPLFYNVRCADNTIFVADAVANHVAPVSQ